MVTTIAPEMKTQTMTRRIGTAVTAMLMALLMLLLGQATNTWANPQPAGNRAPGGMTARSAAAPAAPPAAPVVACSQLGYARAVNYAVGNNPTAVAVGDFNRDGNPDLAAANKIDDSVSVLLGNGAGGFGAAVTYPVGTLRNPTAVAVGDFNRDGNPDLAVGTRTEFLIVLLGDGAGNFAPGGGAIGPAYVAAVAVGDFNRDGNLDLATAQDNGNSVAVRLNNGAGGFPTSTTYWVGTSPVSVAVGDFNQDGNLDLATANVSSNNVSVLLGTGTGSLGAVTNFVVGTNPRSVAVGDFNRDGHPDLATANEISNNVSVLLGTGTGSFGAATNFPVSTWPIPKSIAVGDFNGDGNPDLATANYSENNVSVLLGDGTGSFGAASNFAVSTGSPPARPVALAVGDFNRDGHPDFATANYDTRKVSVLLNLCGATPTATRTPFPSATPTFTETPTATSTPPAPATATPLPPALLVGHLTWQGRPAQPDPAQQLPLTLTLRLGATTATYTATTDRGGVFTVPVATLPGGVYTWWVKGPQYLATSGTVTLTGAPATQQELSLQRAGDITNDNLVDITDFSLLRATFGKACGDAGYDGRADFTGDCLVDISDFTLLRGNFGTVGAAPPAP